jgi:hypothetical protein
MATFIDIPSESSTLPMSTKGPVPRRGLGVKVQMIFYPSDALRDAIWEAADGDDINVSEWIVRTIAAKLKRPDLAVVPRKRLGRPRTARPGNGHP